MYRVQKVIQYAFELFVCLFVWLQEQRENDIIQSDPTCYIL